MDLTTRRRKGRGMARTLTIRISTPDAEAMRLRYHYMWQVMRGGFVLGWGHTNSRDDAEEEAWDLVASRVPADEIDTVKMLGA